MSDLIIKPSGTNANFKVQNPSGTNKITMDSDGVTTIASNTTFSGTGNNIGTATAGTLGSAVTFPAGHVIGSNRGIYNFTGDLTISTTSEAWGPVVSLTLRKANANIYAFYEINEYYATGTWQINFNVAYKSSSFTAAQGNDSHGGSLLNQSGSNQNQLRSWSGDRGSFIAHVFNQHSLGNSAGDTYYFAPETLGNAAVYVNYQGAGSSVTLNVMELA